MKRQHKKLVLQIKDKSLTLVQNAQVVGGELIVLEQVMKGEMGERWKDSAIDVHFQNLREITACFLNLAGNSWVDTNEILGNIATRREKKLVRQIKDRSLTLVQTQELIASELLFLAQALKGEMKERWKDSAVDVHFQNMKEIMTGYMNLSGTIHQNTNEILGK